MVKKQIENSQDSNAPGSRTLILPHWRIEGGAGYYISDLIKSLRHSGEVLVGGAFASDYDKAALKYRYLDTLSLLSLPTYEGVRTLATLYNLLISLLRVINLIVSVRNNYCKQNFKNIIFTSSIQAVVLLVTRHLFPNVRIFIIVQENVNLSRGFGLVTRYFLQRADVVVAITDAWAKHASINGIKPVVIKNNYDTNFASPFNNTDPEFASELLYVGGGAKIKGFDTFLSAVPQLLSLPGQRVVCLGHFDASALDKLKQIASSAHASSELIIHGLVADIRPYLRGTKLLLLPIDRPHFCRPAIEAGLFEKTFIITDYPELTDFVYDGENCLTFRSGDTGHFVDQIRLLLETPELLEQLGRSNKSLSKNYISKTSDINKLANIL